jgi:hypothetical protein
MDRDNREPDDRIIVLQHAQGRTSPVRPDNRRTPPPSPEIAALGKASSSFPMLVVEEEGDRMTFRVRALGQVAAGAVDVADDHVQLQVTLP